MESEDNPGILAKWRSWSFIELPIFLCVCSTGMIETVFSDLILYQTCRTTLGEAHYDTCDILHNNSSSKAAMDLEKLIQPRATYILLCKSLVEGIFPAFLSLFLGPWSDKYGRKPILIAAVAGLCIKLLGLSILSIWNLNPWMYILPSIPRTLMGGTCALMLSTFCYISDITNNDNRAWRLACFENSLAGGLVVGTLIGPLIFQKFGYAILFFIATVICALALLDIIFFIPERVKCQSVRKWGNPFDFGLVKELFQTATKKRPGLDRVSLWSCIGILSLYVMSINGEINTGYLFTSARLGWNVIQYSQFCAIGTVLAISGISVGIKIFKWLGLTETNFAFIGGLSSFSGAMVTAFTLKPWHIYVAAGFGIFSGLISPPVRSILSKSVPPADIGKVFSLATSTEAMLPLATEPLITYIYSHYMPPVYPSPVYLLYGSIFFCALILIMVIDRQQKRSSNNSPYDSLIAEN